MKKIVSFHLLLLSLSFSLWGEERVSSLKFEVYVSDKPTVMFQMFRPILDQAEVFLSEKLKRPIKIELSIAPDYEQTIENLAEGRVDFGRVGPASYVVIKDKEPGLQMIAMELVKGKKEFEGYIICQKDSPLKSLVNLKGKSFAFGDHLSTIGRYLPQAALVKAGIRSKDLKKMEFLNRHDKVAMAVLNGDFDAGAVKSGTFTKFENNGVGLRQLTTLKNVTKPWIARKGLSSEVVTTLQQFLLQLKDTEVLKNLDDSSGFSAGSPEDYWPIREAIKTSQGF